MIAHLRVKDVSHEGLAELVIVGESIESVEYDPERPQASESLPEAESIPEAESLPEGTGAPDAEATPIPDDMYGLLDDESDEPPMDGPGSSDCDEGEEPPDVETVYYTHLTLPTKRAG